MRTLISIWLFLPLALWAQTSNWQTINLNPSIEIQNIKSDTLGFLWMNDKHNLYQFNGLELDEKFNLINEEITSLENQGNQFLIGTSAGRIIIYNPYNSQKSSLFYSNKSLPITAILYLDRDHFVAVSYGFGIYLMHEGQLIEMDINTGLVSNEVYDIIQFNNAYYLATDQGIQVIDPNHVVNHKMITIADGLADIVITHLESHNEKLWFTDYNGHLSCIDQQHNIKNYAFPFRSKVNGLHIHNQGIYIPTDEGLLRFKDKHFIKTYPDLKADKVREVGIDEEGNIWLAAADQKLLKANVHFQKFNTDFSDIRAFAKVGADLIVGNQEGLFITNEHNTSQICANNITHLAVLGNYLLVGTFSHGIKVYNKDFKLVDQVEEWAGIKNQSVLHIYPFDNSIYISSLSGVMQFQFKNEKLSPILSINPLIGPGYIYTIIGKEDRMFFGTDRKGLIEWNINTDKISKHENFLTGEQIGSVYSITFDQNEKLWFTSVKEGIGYLEKGSPNKINLQQHIPNDYTSIAALETGNILAVRPNSVDVINLSSGHIMNFDKELSIQNEVTYLNTIYQDSLMTYFVHDQNIYSYIPDDQVKIYPEVIIDEVLVNLSPKKNIHIFPQNENNIEFKYRASWLTDPTTLQYQYLLEGVDVDWQQTKDNSIAFSRLEPGHYNFRIKASENDFFNGANEDNFEFEIKKHFYNKWWVRTLGLFLILFLGWKFIKGREERKKEKLAIEKLNIENQFINLKNQLNPHFLFNAFNTLIGLIEEDSDRSVYFVERMTDFYRNMLEHGKQNLISLAQEQEMLSQYIDILKARFNGQLDIRLNLEDQLEDYQLPPMTLQLLLENAVKHNVVSTKNPLQITIHQTGNKISVHNKKVPLVQSVKSTKTGLENIKRRFELINMKIPIIKDSAQYFEVIIELKKANS